MTTQGAEVMERHREKAEAAMLSAVLHCRWGVDDCGRCRGIKSVLASAFAEFEREVLERAAQIAEGMAGHLSSPTSGFRRGYVEAQESIAAALRSGLSRPDNA